MILASRAVYCGRPPRATRVRKLVGTGRGRMVHKLGNRVRCEWRSAAAAWYMFYLQDTACGKRAIAVNDFA